MKDRSKANRGRDFETFINFANEMYQRNHVACIHKVPTEFIPLRDRNGKVCGCKVEQKSCVDYLGRYKHVPVAIEANTSGRKLTATSTSAAKANGGKLR